MSSDYLKQLQLTKQLEQKARELARERREAEARLAAARDALSFARKFDLDVADVEATLAAASEAFSQREHAASMAHADECLRKLRDIEQKGAATIAESVHMMLGAIGGSAELEERLDKALMSSRPDEALALVDAIRADVDKEAGERLKRRAARAHELLRYADSIGVRADIGSEDIDAVLVRLSDSGPEPAWDHLDMLTERLLAPFRSLFDKRCSDITDLVAQASRAEVDLSTLTDLVDEAEDALRSCEAERAFELLGEAEKHRPDILNEGVRQRINVLKGEAYEVGEKGGKLSVFKEELRRSEKAAGAKSLEPLHRASEALQEARTEVLMNAICTLRPRLLLSHRLGVDISEALSLLDEARRSLTSRKLSDALGCTERARGVLDAGLSGHFALSDELGRTRELFLAMRDLRLPQGEPSRMVAESRELALSGKLDEARSLLVSAAARLNTLMFDAGIRRAISGITGLSQAIAVGAKVDDQRERLLDALKEFRNGQPHAVSELEDISSLLQSASSEAVAERVRCASERISSPPVDLSGLTPRIDDARRFLDEGKLLNAVCIARDVEAEAMARQRDVSIIMSRKAEDLLALSRVLGCTSETVEHKMGLAQRFVDPADTAAIYADVISYAAHLIRDELTSLLARLSRDIATARRNGVWVDKASKLSEDAAHRLNADDVKGCHQTMLEARTELERLAALHIDLYNRIAFLSRALGSSGLPPKNPAQARIDATKRLFEAGKYDGARVSAAASLQVLEASAAASLVPGRIENARDLVALLQDMSLDLPDIHSLMQKAKEAHQRDRHEEALSYLKDIEQAASETIRKGLKERMDETSSRLAHCSILGCDVASASNILGRAASLLNESRYQDALRAVRFASSEGERLLALFRSVEANLERGEMFLEEAEEFGVQVREAHALLKRAHEEMHSGKQSLALERGRMVHELTFNAVSARLDILLNEIESKHALSDLAGYDLRSWGIDRQTVSNALHRGPRWAYMAAERYDEILSDVAEMRSRALSVLDAISPNTPAREAKAAREAFERGDFSHCIAVLAPVMAEEPMRSALWRRRLTILDELRDRASITPDTAVDHLLDAMATAPPKRFWVLRGEVLEAISLRQREVRRKRIGQLIDSLRAITLLRAGSMSDLAERFLSCPLSELRDDDLRLVEELSKEAEEAVVAEIERARNDGARDAAHAALAEAEALLKDGSLTLAARAVREAHLARDWTVEERAALWRECTELVRNVSALEALGGQLEEVRDLLQESLISSPDRSREAMADAWSLVMKEGRLLLPAIRVEVLHMAPSADGWNRVSTVLVNEGGIAVGLRTVAGEIRGVLPDFLPPGERCAEFEVRRDAAVRLLYRPLLSSKEESSPVLTKWAFLGTPDPC